jgi:hypothetical protein
MTKEILIAISIGIGLSASCGFRVFVPMLVAAIAAKMGIVPVQEGFQWLAGWTAIICFGTATVFEIMAYYIPVVDNLLDTVTTPLAIAAGTLLFTSVLPVDNDILKWAAGFFAGGGSAAVVQGGTVLTRLAATKFTAGAGNAVVATGEHAAALSTSVLSLFLPVTVAVIFVLMIIYLILKFGRRLLKSWEVN